MPSERPKRRQKSVRLGGNCTGLWLACLIWSVFGSGTIHAASCENSSGAAAVAACQKELASKPRNVNLRVRYADALMAQERYQEAVGVLREGLTMYPGDGRLKRRYRLASSLAEEQKSLKRLSVAKPAAGTSSNVNEILCTKLKGERALAACNNVLKTDPDNVVALARRGDELMALDRVERAVFSYRLAVDLDPANATLQRKLKIAEARMPEPEPVAEAEPPLPVQPPTRQERIIEPSKPKIYVPPAKSPPQKEEADVAVIAVTEPVEPAKPRYVAIETPKLEPAPVSPAPPPVKPKVVQRYSNAPLAGGATF